MGFNHQLSYQLPDHVHREVLGQCVVQDGKWQLISPYFIKCSQVVEFQLSRFYSGGKYQALGVEAGHGTAVQVHETLAVRGTEVPQSDGMVQRPR